METTLQVANILKEIVKKDSKYDEEAYLFVLSALDYAVSKLETSRHVTGQELLEAIREYGIKLYGPMTQTVLEFWKVFQTEDFGRIVFNMVEKGLLRKTEIDTLRDFENVYDFKEAFKGNFN